jgi:hypothetical protein
VIHENDLGKMLIGAWHQGSTIMGNKTKRGPKLGKINTGRKGGCLFIDLFNIG